MALVTAQMSVSLDGFYAGPKDPTDPKDVAGWLAGPEAAGFFRITRMGGRRHVLAGTPGLAGRRAKHQLRDPRGDLRHRGPGERSGAGAHLDLAADEGIELTSTRVIETPDVAHIRYKVNGRSALSADDAKGES